MKTHRFVAAWSLLTFTWLAVLFSLQSASAITEGNALSNRTYNTDNGPTNSQLTLDFSITQAGVFENILTWGENSGQGGINGVGQSFELFVLRPLNSTNYQVVFGTGYMTVTNVGINNFTISGTPFMLQTNDVIAHYGRGIPFDNGTGGPSSVYINNNLPVPVVGTTITVPSTTYPLYDDGGRNYAIQVQVVTPLVVLNNNDSGPGSLRQVVLNAAALGGEIIYFTNTLADQTITLTNGQIELSNNITIDGSALANGIRIDGNASSRIFQVDNNATVVLNSLTITNGSDNSDPNHGGGGVVNFGNLTLTNCVVTGNQSFKDPFFAPFPDNGGGGLSNLGNLMTSQCTFSGNHSSGLGGGIINVGIVVLRESTLLANTAVSGGAFFTKSGSQQTFEQCTMIGNTAVSSGAGGFGGAVDISGGTVAVIQCTICSNSASSGGGALNGGGTVTISNTIAAGNSPNNITLTFTGSNNLTNGNPLLAALGNYGGPTQTMPPLPGSPAIDAGSDTVTNFLATDQRGSARLVGVQVDIGAVESGGLWVQNGNDTGPGSLRFVLTNAAATVTSPKIINFVPSLSGQTINLASQLLVTDTNGVTVDASALTSGIQINGDAVTRVFYVTNGAMATLNSLTIDYGLAPGGNFASGGGGGGLFCNTDGRVALLNCSVVNNFVPGPDTIGGFAGGIACYGGYVALTNCTVADNEVFGPDGYGGAFYNYLGTLIFDHCTVANNLAASVNGGEANGGSTMLHATILANGNNDFYNVGGGISLGDNFIADGTSSGLANGVNGDQILTGGSPSSALLAPMGNYSGPTPTMPPLPGSPAIDAGGPPDTATDQRGSPRLLGLAADIGAVEGVLNTRSETLTGATRLGDGSVQFSFTNLTDESFSVLASTNVSLPVSSWTPIGSAVENPVGSGHFQFTDPQAAVNYPQRFYRVTSP